MTAFRALKVATLGTSLTAGGAWRDVLREKLAASMACPVTVENFARTGANALYGLAILPDVAALEPDVVTIEFAVNDASLLRGISLLRSRAAMEAIVTKLRGDGWQTLVLLMIMNPCWGLPALVRPRYARYCAEHVRIALACGAIVVDHRLHWAGLSASERRREIPDGLHPAGPASAERTAQAIRCAVEEGLRRRIDRRSSGR